MSSQLLSFKKNMASIERGRLLMYTSAEKTTVAIPRRPHTEPPRESGWFAGSHLTGSQ